MGKQRRVFTSFWKLLWHNLDLFRLFLFVSACVIARAQSGADDFAQALGRASQAKNEIERDRLLRVSFLANLAGQPETARRYLPLVIDRPWIGDVNFRDACALAQAVGDEAPDVATAERLVLMVGLHNPSLALRESGAYLGLPGGTRLFTAFVHEAPDEAVTIASGTSREAAALRELLSGTPSAENAVIVKLAQDGAMELPRRRRAAFFAARIARGEFTVEAAQKLAGDTRSFFSTAVDMRIAASDRDAPALERALEYEALLLCQAAREAPQQTLAGTLSQFRARDLYALLSLGRAEATPDVFGVVFDRLLLPKWKAETPIGHSLTALLDRTNNWELRDFTAGAVAARRFDALLAIAGGELVTRLAGGIGQASDPIREGMRFAEVIDITTSAPLRQQMASVVMAEFARSQQAGDLRSASIYGLLAAKLSAHPVADPYLPFFHSSETLDTAILFGKENDCIERHFFYDDEDGVRSFDSFRKAYAEDPAWEIEDGGAYLHLTGRDPSGRRIEVFANVPVDTHLPKNRALEGEWRRRQQAITDVLKERGSTASVVVHRGHSFWVKHTMSYLDPAAQLVFLGSCGGLDDVHTVLGLSHDAQVIATRGIGETAINDDILKALNDRILHGAAVIPWGDFWRELGRRWGGSGLFRDYVAPHQNASIVFLRAYYRLLDTLN